MADFIQPQVDCATAREFLEAVSPLGPYFNDVHLRRPWLFRGQGKDYDLVPSLFRPNGRFAELRSVGDYAQTKVAERDLLVRFFEIADKRGLILPDDTQTMRSILATLNSDQGTELLRSDVALTEGWEAARLALSLAALAQHYGVPTRLLDWTPRPLVAAFFAAEDAWRSERKRARKKKILEENCEAARGDTEEPPGPLVVWAFYFPAMGKRSDHQQGTDPVRVVTAPSATNPNLRAQQGVFTWIHWMHTGEARGTYNKMDKALAELAAQKEADSQALISGCRMRKFTLPTSEADHLLYLLAKLDVSPSAIYPGYRGVLRDIEMEVPWWPAPVNNDD